MSIKAKTTVSKKVTKNIMISMIVVNFITIVIMGTYLKGVINGLEENYLSEIVSNISAVTDTTVHEYVSISNLISQGDNVKNILAQSSKLNPMHTNENASTVINELNNMASNFKDSIMYIGLLSVAQDAYLLSTGDFSDDSFSFKERPYYNVISTKNNVITDPYLDANLGSMVISVLSPVIVNGNAVGAVIIDFNMNFLTDLIEGSKHGETGSGIILDSSNNILAYKETSYIGKNYTTFNINSEQFDAELNNITGKLVTYELGNTEKVAVMGKIGDTGWKMITSLNLEEYQSHENTVLTILISLLVLSVVIVLVIIALSIKSSLKPLEGINKAVDELAKGNLSYEFNTTSNDEIGELAKNLRRTTSNLSKYINEIDTQLTSFGKGDFILPPSQTQFVGDFKSIEDAIQKFVKLMSTTLVDLKTTISQVTIGSERVAVSAQSLAHGSEEQAEGISQLNEYITEITKSIHDNSESSNTVTEMTTVMINELNDSNMKMQDMLRSMEDISVQSNEIKKIVAAIENIASQTNILSLNAAVEAARAGSAGSGFAVVANEVRNLASLTSAAVKNTASLVDNTTAAVDVGNEIANSTATNLGNVTEKINNFIEQLASISAESKHQAVAITEINQGVSKISEVMQSNAVVSTESAATAEELSSQANIMNGSVSNFKVK